MPTDDNLCSRGCAIVSMCSLCLQSVETSDHLFFHCTVAASLWTWLRNSLQLVFDVSSIYALLHSLPISCSTQLKDIYLAAVVHLIHSIWWARNNSRFSSNRVYLQAVQVRVHSLIGMSGGLSTGKYIAADSSIIFLQLASLPSLWHHNNFLGLVATGHNNSLKLHRVHHHQLRSGTSSIPLI